MRFHRIPQSSLVDIDTVDGDENDDENSYDGDDRNEEDEKYKSKYIEIALVSLIAEVTMIVHWHSDHIYPSIYNSIHQSSNH